jgi:hypothetical protein
VVEGEGGAKGTGAGVSVAAIQQLGQYAARGEAPDLGLLEGALELALREDRGEVEQRPRGGGDRDAVASSDVARVQPLRAVHAHARAVAHLAADDRDVDVTLSARPDLPQRRRRVVAQHGGRSAREDCRHLRR